MKTWIGLLFYSSCLNIVLAQGTLVFEAYPTRPGLFFPAYAVFTLDGNVLDYDYLAPFGDDIAQIRGPGIAHGDQEAPVLFELNLIYCDPPLLPGHLGGCFYEGTLTLSDNQMTELISGQWYMKSFVSHNPAYFTEGQIVLVPEPVLSIWIAAGALFVVTFAKARRLNRSCGL